MSSDPTAPPLTPGVGARRKGPRALPSLPASAFSPPNTGTSSTFPLPPSPATAPPAAPADAHVRGAPETWAARAGDVLRGQGSAVVLALAEGADAASAPKEIGGVQVLAVLVPLGTPAEAAHVHYSTRFSGLVDPAEVKALQAALARGKTVDVEAQQALEEQTWDALEDFLTQAAADTTGHIVLSNVLPPPDDLRIPIVKLLNHPTYRAYQANVAALSLVPRTLLRLQPPAWGAAPPPTPHAPGGGPAEEDGSGELPAEGREQREWKRRIKMYLGPALEAFGFERIMFGSAAGQTGGNAADWYELAYESFSELGVEQEAIDAVFGGNARRVYGATAAAAAAA